MDDRTGMFKVHDDITDINITLNQAKPNVERDLSDPQLQAEPTAAKLADQDILRVNRARIDKAAEYIQARCKAIDKKKVANAQRTLVKDSRGKDTTLKRSDIAYDINRG